jgi:hypothetical protein
MFRKKLSAPIGCDTYTCSFCKKGHGEVRNLIAGPGVSICDSCVSVCKNLLDKASLANNGAVVESRVPNANLRFVWLASFVAFVSALILLLTRRANELENAETLI